MGSIITSKYATGAMRSDWKMKIILEINNINFSPRQLKQVLDFATFVITSCPEQISGQISDERGDKVGNFEVIDGEFCRRG